MYFYSMINHIDPEFLRGCVFGMLLLISLGCLFGALLATNKFEFFCCFAMLMLTSAGIYLVSLTGAL